MPAGHTLAGLPGTHGRQIEAVRFAHADSAARLLRWAPAITTTGPLGTINIYRDDDGRLRCERYYFLRTAASATFGSIDDAVAWLRTNLPLIGKEAA